MVWYLEGDESQDDNSRTNDPPAPLLCRGVYGDRFSAHSYCLLHVGQPLNLWSLRNAGNRCASREFLVLSPETTATKKLADWSLINWGPNRQSTLQFRSKTVVPNTHTDLHWRSHLLQKIRNFPVSPSRSNYVVCCENLRVIKESLIDCCEYCQGFPEEIK